jgi:hypothetical protein
LIRQTIQPDSNLALTTNYQYNAQGLEHKGVQLPAAINFTHYTHGTGQVRSNTFVNSPWQLREFKTDIALHQQKAQPMGWI